MQRAAITLVRGDAARHTAIIVPTRAAASELRRTIENELLLSGAASAVLLPDVVTRGDFYDRLSERIPGLPAALTGYEREALFRLAARSVGSAGASAPFRLRAGLLVEILRLYDELRRNHRTVDDFHRLVSGELGPVAETDRGAERLLRQADFLAAAFAEFERRAAATGRIDEHGLRSLLLERSSEQSFRHVIVTVADQAADAHGLWTADFDLLARIPGLAQVDIVATERVLASGFHQRVHERHLPGIEEIRMGVESAAPALVVPGRSPGAALSSHYTCRDREEELVEVARSVKRGARARPLERTAVVFQRPLPYLYLARQVFGGAHVPYQAVDALPLAGEPFAAALDLVFTFVAAEGTRAATLELLSSPHWEFVDPESGSVIQRSHLSALDSLFREVKYLGGWDRLAGLAEGRAQPALRAAAALADEISDAAGGSRASAQIGALTRFIARHERPLDPSDPWHARHLRARSAVLAVLDGLREACERHDDEPVPFVELAATIRRWIEGQTFAPRTGTAGVSLMDATAAAFADVDELRIVGLVDGDWPDRSSKSIFFPAKLLEPLGWPSQTDRLAAARARFHDLLRLPSADVSASTFTLEDDAIVAASVFLEELENAGLELRQDTAEPVRVFDHEALSMQPVNPAGASGTAALWLAFRQQLPPPDAPGFHGAAGRRAPGVYAVSRIERYLECPFKYFAASVLRLNEERDEESGLTPQERGALLHEVFEAFFREWDAAGGGAITAQTLEPALALFETVADARLQQLPEADRTLERTHLLGSAVAPGLAERAFAFEIEHGVGVVERLLEHALEGTFVFNGPEAPREISLRAKADRIDLLEDGTLRIIDYKIGRAPKPSRAIQLSVYGTCARQQLDGRHGRSWTVSRAGYVAFREKNAFVSVGADLQKALADGQQRLVSAVTAIEEGTFPPRPEDPWLCSRCGYAMVCRKDYVGDD